MNKHQRVWLENHTDRDEGWLMQAVHAGFDVHHVDGDGANNDPGNLVLIECSDHHRLHGKELGPVGNYRGEWQYGDAPHKVILGERGYNLRKEGNTWAKVGKLLGYDSNASSAAIAVSRAYAMYHRKSWPLPHLDSCLCCKCKAVRMGR